MMQLKRRHRRQREKGSLLPKKQTFVVLVVLVGVDNVRSHMNGEKRKDKRKIWQTQVLRAKKKSSEPIKVLQTKRNLANLNFFGNFFISFLRSKFSTGYVGKSFTKKSKYFSEGDVQKRTSTKKKSSFVDNAEEEEGEEWKSFFFPLLCAFQHPLSSLPSHFDAKKYYCFAENAVERRERGENFVVSCAQGCLVSLSFWLHGRKGKRRRRKTSTSG